MTVEDLRLQFEKETKENWMTNPVCHGELGFASWNYQKWLEQKAIQVQAGVSDDFGGQVEERLKYLDDLLCLIHRDGGHHIQDNGYSGSYKKACEKIFNWLKRDDSQNSR